MNVSTVFSAGPTDEQEQGTVSRPRTRDGGRWSQRSRHISAKLDGREERPSHTRLTSFVSSYRRRLRCRGSPGRGQGTDVRNQKETLAEGTVKGPGETRAPSPPRLSRTPTSLGPCPGGARHIEIEKGLVSALRPPQESGSSLLPPSLVGPCPLQRPRLPTVLTVF